MAENKMEQWLKYLNECKKSTDNIELDPRDIRELIGLLIELKERRNGGSYNSNARKDFMAVVYDELSDDADNFRANRIIDAADAYADSFNDYVEDGREDDSDGRENVAGC